MGSASVTYCYYSGSATGKTGAQMAWTKGYSGASIIQPDPSYGITNLQSSFSDGVLTCSFVRNTPRLLRLFGFQSINEYKICSQTIFDPQNSMVAFPKSQDEAVTSSFWPHLRKFKIPPDGIMLEQIPSKVHIEIHQGLHFCCKLKNFLSKILGTCPS